MVSHKGDVMPPNIFPHSLRFGAKDYVNMLKTKGKPWMESVSSGNDFVFPQDFASVHKARITQSWLGENVTHHWLPNVWPPSSPDRNSLNYNIYGVVEREVNSKPYNMKEELKDAITVAMGNLYRDMVVKAYMSF